MGEQIEGDDKFKTDFMIFFNDVCKSVIEATKKKIKKKESHHSPSFVSDTPFVHIATIRLPYFYKSCKGLYTRLAYKSHLDFLVRTHIWPKKNKKEIYIYI